MSRENPYGNSSLARHIASGPDPDKTCHLRRAAFRERNIAWINLDECKDPWVKQVVINEVRRQLGV